MIGSTRSVRVFAYTLPTDMRKGFEGVAMTDGYTAYQSLARSSPNLELAHCWAHVRRKFLEAADFNRELSEQAVGLINRLFEIEREVPRAGPGAYVTLAAKRAIADHGAVTLPSDLT